MPSATKKIQEVDEYIAAAAPFARPILKKLRSWVHRYADGVEEKIRWGFPHFDLEGQRMGFMAAFSKHAAFGFTKATQMADAKLIEKAQSEEAMGHLGKLFTVDDLPKEAQFAEWIHKAIAVHHQPVARKKSSPQPAPEIPEDFQNRLTRYPEAFQYFQALSNSHRREYLVHIEEAKKPETRNRRIEKTIQALQDAVTLKNKR